MWNDTARRLRALPAVVWGLGIVSLFTDAASDMVVPLLPELIAGLGGGALALGAMEGLAELSSAALKVGAGAAIDRGVRPGPLVVVGYGLAALVRPLYAFAGAPWHAMVLRSLDRIGKGMRSAPRDGMLAASVGEGQRGLAFGVHRGMDNMGAVVGGGLAFLLLGLAGLTVDQVLLVSVVPGIISTAIAIGITRRAERARPPEPKTEGKAEPRVAVPLPSAARRFLVVVGLFSLSASTDTFLLAHLRHQGLDVKWLPLAWISLQLAKALLNIPGGAIADRIGPKRSLALGWCVYALTYLGFVLSPSPAVTWLLFLFYGVHYGLTEGAEKAFIAASCPPLARGRGYGLLAAIGGAALLPANLLFGVLYDKSSMLAFGTAAAIAGIAAALVAVVVPATDPA
ncbi:MAG: MFS transporter [Polyangiaceae bacterium]|nr:MFS transporter [Polyangiaceae bacterium]